MSQPRTAAFGQAEDLRSEVTYLRLAIQELQDSFGKMLYAAPAKVWEGRICLADGTSWNPGSGVGLYQYLGGVWNKL